ncbi:TetR/AcrR family transcriptional regulator [Kineosporia mesophila]|uniref:TetR/AcrR family transcriptional regulator n=1 Tax=Kineosporia mesophila TaxID=566012 RepID=A0ABP6Z6P1_9ACTN|nr:TetR/AcrR family transcriptional regulator [Kineosporia mesophila]MCD5352692.1 TetR/AcrR family transcriptional regulator [Kineosporia mesophila]
MNPQTSRKPRTDAHLNRLRILGAARRAYATDGLDVPVRTIAGRAGIGTATLYRHFPTRTDLLDAVLAERVVACEADLVRAQADPDAWSGLTRVIRHFADTQLSDPAITQMLLGTSSFVDRRRDHAQALNELVHRAREAGALREGVTVTDVRAGLLAIASIGVRPAGRAHDTVRRLENLLLAGLRSVPGPR